ncbi:MAG: hypothetical protein RLZZ50_646 [Verrucomicrobiota bacterium]
MRPIPREGAWFALRWVAAARIPGEALPVRYGGVARAVGNAILALVTRRDFSALHRLRTDETWHFYGGDAAELLLLHPDGRAETISFGGDVFAGEQPQVTVPAGVWMGARPVRDTAEAYSFFGCSLAPGFDYADYEHGYRDELQKGWPAETDRIAALTREDSLTRPVADQAAPVSAPALVSRVFGPEEGAQIQVAPGVSLRELLGRTGVARTEAVSVARFRLEAGASSGSSRYLGCDEFFLVLSGTGVATLNGMTMSVGPGSVVVIARGDPHELKADATGPLEFLTVLAPAFNPAHYLP